MCLERVRKKVDEGLRTRDGKVKFKYHWQCEKCRQWFRDQSSIEVDHIEEVGPFNGNFDDYIKRMYCPQSNLQALCISCHSIKTAGYSAHLRFSRKKS